MRSRVGAMQMKEIIPGLTQKHKSIRALSQVLSKPIVGFLPEMQVHTGKVENGKQPGEEQVCTRKKKIIFDSATLVRI